MASMLASNPPQGQAAPEPRLAPLATADQMAELRRRLARLERDYAAADRDRQALAEVARQAVQQRDLILGSTLWRLTQPLRQAASWVPAPLRHALRRAARTARRGRDPAPTEVPAPPPPEAAIPHDAAIPAAALTTDGPVLATLLLAAGADALPRLERTVASLRAQPGPRWRLLIGVPPALAPAATALVAGDPRCRLHPAEAEPAALLDLLLQQAEGEYVGVLDCGDTLALGAIAALEAALDADPGLDLLYGDETVADDAARPRHKPGWSPALLQSGNYLGRPCLVRRDLALRVGGFAAGLGGAAEWHLLLQASRLTEQAGRVPRILCHRTAAAPPPQPEAIAALGRFWAAQGIEAEVAALPDGTLRAGWAIAAPPLVSIIVAPGDDAGRLQRLLDDLLPRTAYAAREVILVAAAPSAIPRRDDMRPVRHDAALDLAARYNLGAAAARGSLLLFLREDAEATDPDWLAALVRQVQSPGVGIVGAPAEAGEAPPRERLWLGDACLLVRREVFARIGGFDESYRTGLAAAALCLAGWRAGYRSVAVPGIRHAGPEVAPEAEDALRLQADRRRMGLTDDRFAAPGGPAPHPDGPSDGFSLFDDAALEGAARDGSADRFLWAPPRAEAIADPRAAMRWVIDLLRSRGDLRLRFPRALSAGPDGAFARWLQEEGARLFGLDAAACRQLGAAFAEVPGRRPRQALLTDPALAARHPLGGTPAGLPALFADLVTPEAMPGPERFTPEEILWFCLECHEDPAGELVRALLFNPDWQRQHPAGITVFGRDALAAWLRRKYRIDDAWIDPAGWPETLPPDQQLRLAWQAFPSWREAHPDPFADPARAAALLAWLASSAAALAPAARAWCAALDTAAVAAALAVPGLNLIGHFCYPSGLRTSVEALAEAAATAGIPTAARDMHTDAGDDPRHAEFAGMEPFETTLIHVQPEPFLPTAYSRAGLHERRPRSTRIGYWYWELEAIPPRWQAAATGLDEVWTATRFVADALRARLTVPVHIVMPGIRPTPFTPLPRAAFGLSEDRFTFCFVFHMMSVMDRKNPAGLLRAFRRAFPAGDKVALVLKTTHGERHPAQKRALQEAADAAGATLIDEVWSQERTLALMAACDCYVSLHRSEGLGLTMAEAMLLGRPVIATGYSGNLDFMHDGNSLLVEHRLVPLRDAPPPYDVEARWAEPSEEHAAALMRQIWQDPAAAAALGARARADITATCSMQAAGARLAAQLARLHARH
jgi:glycosyltransferase involved in cell wall biosynthesis